MLFLVTKKGNIKCTNCPISTHPAKKKTCACHACLCFSYVYIYIVQVFSDFMQNFSFSFQGSIGKCNSPKPGAFDFVGKAKWTAWNDLGDLSKVD